MPTDDRPTLQVENLTMEQGLLLSALVAIGQAVVYRAPMGVGKALADGARQQLDNIGLEQADRIGIEVSQALQRCHPSVKIHSHRLD